jgi:hypothetical protein
MRKPNAEISLNHPPPAPTPVLANRTSEDFLFMVDGVRICNRALSAAEVKQLYNMHEIIYASRWFQ